MPTTPDKIAFAVQRCRELASGIENTTGVSGVITKTEERAAYAVALLPHLAVVLAELDRLREVERNYLNLLHLEHGERRDGD